MRIAYVSFGHNVYDARFLRKMVEKGHEPTLISYWPHDVSFEMKGVQFVHWDPKFPRGVGVVLRHVRPFFWGAHLRTALRRIRPDVLHTGYVQNNGLAGALSGFRPTLLMPWGSDILVHPDQSQYHKAITIFTLRRADMITCDCDLVKRRIIELSGYPEDKIIVFPWGTDLTVFKPSARPSGVRRRLGWTNNKILIMTRNFKEIYGIQYFLAALPEVFRRRPDTRAILLGSGPLEGEYRAQVAQLGIDKFVFFGGRVDERHMASYLNAADIYVSTSLSDGTSASMLEAMACMLPVVVSDAEAYFEWVEDGQNGFIVPRTASAVLAERLLELLDSDALRRRMGVRNLRLARERADWDRNFDKLDGIYATLIGQCS